VQNVIKLIAAVAKPVENEARKLRVKN